MTNWLRRQRRLYRTQTVTVQKGASMGPTDLGPVRPERFSLLAYRPVWFVAGAGWGALCMYWARGLWNV